MYKREYYYNKLLILLLLFCSYNIKSFAQETINIGVKDNDLNLYNENINFLDAFEFEVVKSLKDYLESNYGYQVVLKDVNQDQREKAILEGTVDAILYSFSKTQERTDSGILFSIPYHQNSAIVLASWEGDYTIKDLGKEIMTIGYISNSTGEEIKKVRDRYQTTTRLQAFPSYEDLIEALKNREVNAVVGDMSRLSSDFASGTLVFSGILPTSKAKIRDNYGIAVRKEDFELKLLMDEFLSENELIITSFENKWLQTSITEAYTGYYNAEKEPTNPYLLILYSSLLVLGLAFIGFLVIYQKQKRELKKASNEANELALERFSHIFKQELHTEDIIAEGERLFERANRDILYVGSAGFLAATDENRKKWSLAIHNYLQKNVVLDRIIDLPKFDFENREIIGLRKEHYPKMYMNTAYQTTYIESYVKWLLTQYHNMIYYNKQGSSKYNIYDSKIAAMWGSGIVVILKDTSVDNERSDSQGIYFTTYGGENIGSKIFSPSLALKWGQSIRNVITNDSAHAGEEFQVKMSKKKLKQMFFCGSDHILQDCADKIESMLETSKEPIIEDSYTHELINKAAKNFNNWFFRTV